MQDIETFDDLVNYYKSINSEKYFDIQTGGLEFNDQDGGAGAFLIRAIPIILGFVIVYASSGNSLNASVVNDTANSNLPRDIYESTLSVSLNTTKVGLYQQSTLTQSLLSYDSTNTSGALSYFTNTPGVLSYFTNTPGASKIKQSLVESFLTPPGIFDLVLSKKQSKNYLELVLYKSIKSIQEQEYLESTSSTTQQLAVIPNTVINFSKDGGKGIVAFVNNPKNKTAAQEVSTFLGKLTSEDIDKLVTKYIDIGSQYIDFGNQEETRRKTTDLCISCASKLRTLNEMFLSGNIKPELIALNMQNTPNLIQYYLVLKNLSNPNQIVFAIISCSANQILIETRTPGILNLIGSNSPFIQEQVQTTFLKGIITSNFVIELPKQIESSRFNPASLIISSNQISNLQLRQLLERVFNQPSNTLATNSTRYIQPSDEQNNSSAALGANALRVGALGVGALGVGSLRVDPDPYVRVGPDVEVAPDVEVGPDVRVSPDVRVGALGVGALGVGALGLGALGLGNSRLEKPIINNGSQINKTYSTIFEKYILNEYPNQEQIYRKLKKRYEKYMKSLPEINLSKKDIKKIKISIAKLLDLELNLFKSSEYTFVNAFDKFINN
jgi:hypothetical protein